MSHSSNQSIDAANIQAVVIGGSAGAFSALRALLPAFPPTLRVPVMIVLHVPSDRPSAVADVFRQLGSGRVKEAEDKEATEPGAIYFAPAGYHLLVESRCSLALAVDDPVFFSRPSIDVLFESAADAYGRGLLGVLLSGANQDGAAGLRKISTCGGATVIQDPSTAEHATMPSAALKAARPTAILSIDEIAALFATLGRPAPTVARDEDADRG